MSELKLKNCRDIIKEYLIKNKYDGICNPELECGCGLNDFIPCDCLDFNECYPAYKGICKDKDSDWCGREMYFLNRQ